MISRPSPSASSSAASSLASSVGWKYGHPYTDITPDLILPWGAISNPNDTYSIAQLIPSLPDDPKARFLDEIASTPSEAPDSLHALPTSPKRSFKKMRTDDGPSSPPKTLSNTPSSSNPVSSTMTTASSSSSTATSSSAAAATTVGASSSSAGKDTKPKAKQVNSKRKAEHISVTPGASKALNAVSPEEFWERMAFRQECVQGAVTGFFVAIFLPPPSFSSPPPPPPTSELHPGKGKTSATLEDPRPTIERSSNEGKSDAHVNPQANPSSVTLISNAPSSPPAIDINRKPDMASSPSLSNSNTWNLVESKVKPKPEEPHPGQVPQVVVDRIVSTLLNLDFGSLDKARRATGVIEDTIRSLCGGSSPTIGSTSVEEKAIVEGSGGVADTAANGTPNGVLGDVSDNGKSNTIITPEHPPQPQPDQQLPRPSSSSITTAPSTSSIFETYIFTRLAVNNPPLSPPSSAPGAGAAAAAPVTVLQVRKKRRAPA